MWIELTPIIGIIMGLLEIRYAFKSVRKDEKIMRALFLGMGIITTSYSATIIYILLK